MEEDILERDLKLEKGDGEDLLNEAIEVLNADFSTKRTSPSSDTFDEFNLESSRMEELFTYHSLERNTSNMVVDTKNFVDSEDTPWETILPCTASSIHRHSPETTFYPNLLDQREASMMSLDCGIRRDTSGLSDRPYRANYFGNQHSVSSSWEFGNSIPSYDWGRSFQSSSSVIPSNSCSQTTFCTAYSGPRESERVRIGVDSTSNYVSVSNRCAGREHFHVPSLSSSLSGTKISNAGDSFLKRNKTPTATCSLCMQNISANGGNFQRHREACRRKHGWFTEQKSAKIEERGFSNEEMGSMTDSKTNKSHSSSNVEEYSGMGKEAQEVRNDEMNEQNREENGKAGKSILENFGEQDDRDTYVLCVLQELRNTLMQTVDARCIAMLRESFVALAERSKGFVSDISTSNKFPKPGEQVAMAILFYASC